MEFSSHGLGDCVHAAAALRLYQQGGFDVQLRVEPNKRWVWEAAGIPIYDGEARFPSHPYLYPSDFFDLSKPDHTHSKIAHFFEFSELPKLGTKEEVWRMVCAERIVATQAISAQAVDEIDKFLSGLPQPIVLLHSKGSNFQAQKSIPDGTAFSAICELSRAFDGSIVTLDWDHRAPTLGHERVRPICPYFSHMSIEQLAALFERADLLIGVDSGPFHLAAWFDIATLYVSRDIPPVRCCLPSPNATYLVPSRDHDHWAARGPEWRFVEFSGSEATSSDIVSAATAILDGCNDLVTVADMKNGKPKVSLRPEAIIGEYIYRRVGYDERPMSLLPDGTIGQGAAGCERTWHIDTTPAGQVVAIRGTGHSVTCHLKRGADQILRGRWFNHERMPIELIPLKSYEGSDQWTT